MAIPANTYLFRLLNTTPIILIWDTFGSPIVLKRIGIGTQYLDNTGTWVTNSSAAGMLQFNNETTGTGLGGQRCYCDISGDVSYEYYAAGVSAGIIGDWAQFIPLTTDIVGKLELQSLLQR